MQTYKHNDTDDLLAIMTSIAQDDVRKKRDASQQRRFIVTEGLFRNTGEICNLPGVLALKEKFFYRVIMDESMSFGVRNSITIPLLCRQIITSSRKSCDVTSYSI